MIVKLLTEHHLEFLSLKGGCRGSSESTPVKSATLFEISCQIYLPASVVKTIDSRIKIGPIILSVSVQIDVCVYHGKALE